LTRFKQLARVWGMGNTETGAHKIRKPKIVDRSYIFGGRTAVRGANRNRMICLVTLEDGRKMTMAEYRVLGKPATTTENQRA
jgi:hypothetical protein